MEIRLNLKPMVYERRTFGLYKTKEELKQAMLGDGNFTFSSRYGAVYKTFDGKHVIGMNFTKFRRKVAIETVPQARGKTKKVRKVIREAHWVGYKYLIPVELLEVGNLKVVQRERHFDIVPQ